MRIRTIFITVLTILAVTAGIAVAQNRFDDHPQPGERSHVVDGPDRYWTAAEAAVESRPRFVDVLYIVNGESLADAMVVGGTTGLGFADDLTTKMLYVRSDGVPEATARAFERVRACQVIFVGGEQVIPTAVRGQVIRSVQFRC